jgi:hypothetical protein
VAGDKRPAETSFLTTIHTLLARRHNYWVARGFDYDGARARLEQEIDAAVFDELLPALIGPFADCAGVPLIGEVDKSFVGAFLRIHSMINGNVIRQLSDYGVSTLADVFFNPAPLEAAKGDLGRFVTSMYKTPAFSDNAAMVDDLNRFLFHRQPGPAVSLAVANLRRGEDLGLSDFNSARVAVGLQPYSSFEEFVDVPEVLDLLNHFYPSGPSTCPIWLCARAERPARRSSMGETTSVWFRNQLCGLRRKPDQPEAQVASFSTVLCETTNACEFVGNPFLGTGSPSSGWVTFLTLGAVGILVATFRL